MLSGQFSDQASGQTQTSLFCNLH